LKKITPILILFFFVSSNFFGQKVENLNSNFSLFSNNEITSLFEKYNDLHHKKVTVFKIQLFHHENRHYTWKMKSKYQEMYPNKKTNFVYEPPYFKIHTEHFMTKLSAEQKMDSIKEYFPDCFIIELTIPLKEF